MNITVGDLISAGGTKLILYAVRLSPACAGGHHSDRQKASHALTFKLAHSSGAAQSLSIYWGFGSGEPYRRLIA